MIGYIAALLVAFLLGIIAGTVWASWAWPRAVTRTLNEIYTLSQWLHLRCASNSVTGIKIDELHQAIKAAREKYTTNKGD